LINWLDKAGLIYPSKLGLAMNSMPRCRTQGRLQLILKMAVATITIVPSLNAQWEIGSALPLKLAQLEQAASASFLQMARTSFGVGQYMYLENVLAAQFLEALRLMAGLMCTRLIGLTVME
jgi:hypothetical protein